MAEKMEAEREADKEAAMRYKMKKSSEFKLQSIEDDDSVNNAFSSFNQNNISKVEDVFADDEQKKKKSRAESFFDSLSFEPVEEETDSKINSWLGSFNWGF